MCLAFGHEHGVSTRGITIEGQYPAGQFSVEHRLNRAAQCGFASAMREPGNTGVMRLPTNTNTEEAEREALAA